MLVDTFINRAEHLALLGFVQSVGTRIVELAKYRYGGIRVLTPERIVTSVSLRKLHPPIEGGKTYPPFSNISQIQFLVDVLRFLLIFHLVTETCR